MTIGQYEGEGRGTPVGSPFWMTSSVLATRTGRPFSSSPYFWCHQSSRCVTIGTVSKLCEGVGFGVAHSRLRASHGSLTTRDASRFATTRLYTMFHRKIA